LALKACFSHALYMLPKSTLFGNHARISLFMIVCKIKKALGIAANAGSLQNGRASYRPANKNSKGQEPAT